jgi:ORF6N domain
VEGRLDFGCGALIGFIEVVELLDVLVEGEFFEDGAVGDGVFQVVQGAEGAGVEFYGFDGLGELEFGHGVILCVYIRVVGGAGFHGGIPVACLRANPIFPHAIQKRLSAPSESLVPAEVIERKTYFIRGQKVMLDADLAQLYGVVTGRLNESGKAKSKSVSQGFYDAIDFGRGAIGAGFKIANCDLKARSTSHVRSVCIHGTGRGYAFVGVEQRARGSGQHRHHARICKTPRGDGYSQGLGK